MLDKLEQLLVSNGYLFRSELKSLPDTPCPRSTIQVINFDAIKDHFCAEHSIGNKGKSCDLLLFKKSKNELHFIEMKRVASQTAASFRSTFPCNVPFREKNVHSIFLLISILSHHHADNDLFPALLSLTFSNRIKIRFSVLCNLPTSEMIFITLSTIHISGISFPQILGGEVEIINCETFNSYFSTP